MQIRGELFWRKTADEPHRNPYYYADPFDPDVYVSREYAPLATRLDAYIRYAKAVPQGLAQAKENLRGPLAKPLVDIGIPTIGGLADFYAQEVPKIFAPVLKPEPAGRVRRGECRGHPGGAGIRRVARRARENGVGQFRARAGRSFARWCGRPRASTSRWRNSRKSGGATWSETLGRCRRPARSSPRENRSKKRSRWPTPTSPKAVWSRLRRDSSQT